MHYLLLFIGGLPRLVPEGIDLPRWNMNQVLPAASGKMIKKSAMILTPMKKTYGTIIFHGVRGAESPGLSAGYFITSYPGISNVFGP
jgi:hypothetical protein